MVLIFFLLADPATADISRGRHVFDVPSIRSIYCSWLGQHIPILPRQKGSPGQEVCHRFEISLCYTVTSRQPVLQSGTLSLYNQSIMGDAAKLAECLRGPNKPSRFCSQYCMKWPSSTALETQWEDQKFKVILIT